MTISSPGIGSNLDVNGIVSKLMAVESQPLTVLQTKEASFQAKLSAFGTLQGSLSSLQTAVSALSSASAFQSLTATPSDTTVLSATAASSASAGNYAIAVTTLAQAQNIYSAGQASSTASIGTGTSNTLTFQFGTISGPAPVNGLYSGATFTQDTTQATGTVVIDSSNNSLQGIRDAINAAHMGVAATIVSDGNATIPYHLVLTSASTGLAESMKITSSGGDASVTSLLAYDPAGTQNLTQTAAAQNAALTVNGLAISSASNTISGAIAGVTLNLTKGAGATTNLAIANNTASVTSAIQSFVKAYNSADSSLNSLTSYDPTTKRGGLLLGDFSTELIQNKMRSTLSSALSGLGSNTLTNITQIGISFLKDGTLSLDSSKLQSALSSNFSDFAALFSAIGKPTDSLVNFASSTANSKPGSYAVNVTSLGTQGSSVGSNKATQALLTGSATAALTIGTGTNDQLQVTVDGGATIPVTLTAGVYANATALAAQVQTNINAALTAAGQATHQVTVTQSAGILSVKSNSFGSASSVSVINGGNPGATGLLGGAPTSSTVSTITTGVNDQLALSVNGTSTTVTLAAGTYTASALATQIQSAVNSASAFTAAGITVKASQSGDVLTLTSNTYGASSKVGLTGGSAMSNLFGLAPTASVGADIVGLINGVAAVGSGQFLSGAVGNASEGVRVQVVGGATGARGTVNFSQGYAYNLNTLLTSTLSSTGTIASSTDSANKSIADLQKQADRLNARLTAQEAQYRAQFTALDVLIGQMSTTSNYLTQQLANLPKIT